MKKLIAYILAAFAALALLSGCMNEFEDLAPTETLEGGTPVSVQDFYVEYLETAQNDRYASVYEYCHFEDSERMEMTASGSVILAYEIIGWKVLSDQLWEVEVKLTNETFPSGIYGVNYVGMLDGRYYIMTGIRQIPQDLLDGVVIEPYEPWGNEVVDEDEVIK